MNPYRYTISLRIWHPSFKVDQIAKTIGFDPQFAYEVGTEKKTPKGTLLTGNYDCTYCSFLLKESRSEEQGIEDGIYKAVEMVTHCRNLFEKLRNSGGKVELFLGFFFHSNSGIELDWGLIKHLSNHFLSLSFDIYEEIT